MPTGRTAGSSKPVIDAITTIAILIACVSVVYANWPRIFPPQRLKPILPSDPVSLEGATLRGETTAAVVVIEYSDYKCPFCARFEKETMPLLEKQFITTGQVQLAFRHYPLEDKHPGATRAAEAALCAGRQGRFWDFHASLFTDSPDFSVQGLVERGRDLGMAEGPMRKCLAGEVRNQVNRDRQSASDLHVSGTPSFFIGRRLSEGKVKILSILQGARTFQEFQSAIGMAVNAGVR